ncbi:MAG TPA: hypothetical protein VFI03_08410 [Solirubrobacterales bacterium]|nr:hypothetical protein [Solirubrobacterales bacterium]
MGRAFERIAYGVQQRLIWPLQDRAAALGVQARTISYGAVVLLAAAAGVGGLLLAASGGSSEPPARVQIAAASKPLEVKATTDKPAEPTLQGAAPVFKPAEGESSSEVDPAKAIVESAPAESPGVAGTEESASTSASSSAADEPAVEGPPAGPQAISVARDFAGAFVLYETGETDSTVREAFGETATPALARALLKRPPRLPASVKVPQAKVLNVVPAPSRGSVFPISVSLLRVGATSELRLDLEQQKGEGWRVTNVLG